MSIAADMIAFDGDTALLVVPTPEFSGAENSDLARFVQADRPCETCDGAGQGVVDVWQVEDCIRCNGTGRHTFTIEVESGPKVWGCGHLLDHHCKGDMAWRTPTRSYRVSVIPGMVLPIVVVDGTGYPHPKPADRFAYVTEREVLRVVDAVAKTDTHSGKAPPAAARLMAEGKHPHLVVLKVAS